jgi:hypothetical protein
MLATVRITVFALAIWLSGCADVPQSITIVPDADAASRNVTLEEARATLKSVTGYVCCLTGGRRQITGIDVTDDQALVFIQADGDRSQTLPVSALSVSEWIFDDHGKVALTADHQVVLVHISADLARKVGDALVVIKFAPALQEQQKEQQATFDTQARAYRDATVKPVPGEDVRRYRVQAEAAVSERRFQDAADLYAKALSIAPWWPEGHFNTALILGDLRQYDKAIDHMKKYLALVPNAADARAAQDRVYVWEGEKAALRASSVN